MSVSCSLGGLTCAVLLRSGCLFLLFVVWHRDRINEAFLGDSVVVASVQALLKPGQVVLQDLEAAVFGDPSSEVVHGNVARVAVVHVGIQTLTIQLQLVSLVVHFCVGLDHQTEDRSELLEPCSLEQVSLLDAQVWRGGSRASDWSNWAQCGLPFAEIDCAIRVCVHQLNKSFNIGELDAVLAEDMRDLIHRNLAILIDVEQAERLVHRESFVAHKRSTCIFDATVGFDHELDHPQEHKVLNLTLFLKLLDTLLLFSDFLLLSFNLLINFCSLLLGQPLFLVSLLLPLSRCQVVGRGLAGSAFR